MKMTTEQGFSKDEFRRLASIMGRAVGDRFFDAFLSRFPEGEQDMSDKVSEATLQANRDFAFHVEELFLDISDSIVDDICTENQWGLTKEQLDELEEGKTNESTFTFNNMSGFLEKEKTL